VAIIFLARATYVISLPYVGRNIYSAIVLSFFTLNFCILLLSTNSREEESMVL